MPVSFNMTIATEMFGQALQAEEPFKMGVH